MGRLKERKRCLVARAHEGLAKDIAFDGTVAEGYSDYVQQSHLVARESGSASDLHHPRHSEGPPTSACSTDAAPSVTRGSTRGRSTSYRMRPHSQRRYLKGYQGVEHLPCLNKRHCHIATYASPSYSPEIQLYLCNAVYSTPFSHRFGSYSEQLRARIMKQQGCTIA